jgi:hypothetical protein
LSQVQGKAEDLAEGVVKLRRGQTGGLNEEIGQRLAAGLASPGRSKPSAEGLKKYKMFVILYFCFPLILKFDFGKNQTALPRALRRLKYQNRVRKPAGTAASMPSGPVLGAV